MAGKKQSEKRQERREEAYRLIQTTQWFMEKVARTAAFQKGVTYEQARILGLLVKAEGAKKPLKPLDMAKALLQRPHTVSGILNRMVAKGWVFRLRGAFKGHPNWVEVNLTKEGRGVYQSMPDLDAITVLGFDALTDSELEQLMGLLRKVRMHSADQLRGLATQAGEED